MAAKSVLLLQRVEAVNQIRESTRELATIVGVEIAPEPSGNVDEVHRQTRYLVHLAATLQTVVKEMRRLIDAEAPEVGHADMPDPPQERQVGDGTDDRTAPAEVAESVPGLVRADGLALGDQSGDVADHQEPAADAADDSAPPPAADDTPGEPVAPPTPQLDRAAVKPEHRGKRRFR